MMQLFSEAQTVKTPTDQTAHCRNTRLHLSHFTEDLNDENFKINPEEVGVGLTSITQGLAAFLLK